MPILIPISNFANTSISTNVTNVPNVNSTNEAIDSNDLYNQNFILTHGILLFLAWIIFIPLSMIIVRFGSKFDRWFPLHVSFGILGFIFTIIGCGIGFSYSTTHFDIGHKVMGMFIFLLLFVQITIGIVSSSLWDTTSSMSGTPKLDILHVWLGRIIVLLAFITIFTGYLLSNIPIWIYVITGILECILAIVYPLCLIFL